MHSKSQVISNTSSNGTSINMRHRSKYMYEDRLECVIFAALTQINRHALGGVLVGLRKLVIHFTKHSYPLHKTS